jgi:hypothetical protein
MTHFKESGFNSLCNNGIKLGPKPFYTKIFIQQEWSLSWNIKLKKRVQKTNKIKETSNQTT